MIGSLLGRPTYGVAVVASLGGARHQQLIRSEAGWKHPDAEERAVGLYQGLAAAAPDALEPRPVRLADQPIAQLLVDRGTAAAPASGQDGKAQGSILGPRAWTRPRAGAASGRASAGASAHRDRAGRRPYRDLASRTGRHHPEPGHVPRPTVYPVAHLGRREEALAAIEDAVTSYRNLARARPEAFFPVLAAVLLKQGLHLREAGRYVIALVVDREAVGSYLRLRRTQPSRYSNNFEQAATSLVLGLRDLGYSEGDIKLVSAKALLAALSEAGRSGRPLARVHLRMLARRARGGAMPTGAAEASAPPSNVRLRYGGLEALRRAAAALAAPRGPFTAGLTIRERLVAADATITGSSRWSVIGAS